MVRIIILKSCQDQRRGSWIVVVAMLVIVVMWQERVVAASGVDLIPTRGSHPSCAPTIKTTYKTLPAAAIQNPANQHQKRILMSHRRLALRAWPAREHVFPNKLETHI